MKEVGLSMKPLQDTMTRHEHSLVFRSTVKQK